MSQSEQHVNDFAVEDTAVNKAIQYAGKNWRSWAPVAGGAVLAISGALMALGHRQAGNEMLNQKVDTLTLKMEHFEASLADVREDVAGVKATVNDTQNDVRDLKHLADHAQDVAEQFTVPRLTHRGRK